MTATMDEMTETEVDTLCGIATWVMVRCDHFLLALPQDEVRSIELAADLQAALPHEKESAWYQGGKAPWPVYRLDERMRPVHGRQHAGFVVLFHGENPWGLWGEGVDVVQGEELPREMPMPRIFQNQNSPLMGIAAGDDGQPVLLARSDQLIGLLQSQHGRRMAV